MTQVSVKGNMKFVGIDISKHKLDVCFNDNTTISLSNAEGGFGKLMKKLPPPEECLIVLEPTGGYEKSIIVSLQKKYYNVVLANALKVRRYAEAMGFLAKNDPIDSYVIKSFGEDLYPKGKLAVLVPKTDEFRQLELWLGRSRQLVKLIAIEKQRVEKAFDKMIIKSMHRTIRHLEKELKQVEQKIEKMSDKCQLSEQAEKYKTVKGIGDVCANALVTYLPELGVFNHSQIAALVGVAPYCHESGKSQGKNKIRGGRKILRSLLYMGTLTAIAHNPAIKVFYDRLMRKGKHHNMAMIACLRKLLCILNAMTKNDTVWQENYKVA